MLWKVDGVFNFNNPDGITSNTQSSLSPTIADSTTQMYRVIPRKNILEQELKTRSPMMDSKHIDLQ